MFRGVTFKCVGQERPFLKQKRFFIKLDWRFLGSRNPNLYLVYQNFQVELSQTLILRCSNTNIDQYEMVLIWVHPYESLFFWRTFEEIVFWCYKSNDNRLTFCLFNLKSFTVFKPYVWMISMDKSVSITLLVEACGVFILSDFWQR